MRRWLAIREVCMEMNTIVRIAIFIIFGLLFHSEKVQAFKCFSGSQIIDNTSESFGAGFFDVSISPVQLNKTINKVELTNLSNYARCTGAPESYDALRAISLTMVSPALTDLGYELYLIDGDDGEIDASVLTEATNICLWPDARCSGNYPPFPTFKTFPVFAKIGIKRIAGSGNWHSAVTIPAGTLIAELEARVKMGKSWAYGGQDVRITWKFFLATEMASRAYTCSITQFDNAVTLPTVSRSAMVSHGTGRYPNAKKNSNLIWTASHKQPFLSRSRATH